MENYVTAQLAALCKAVLLGWLSGCVYDLLRSVRLLRRRSRALTHTLDALYGAALLLALLGFALHVGGGQLRLYMLLGAAAGCVLYFWAFRGIFRPLWGFWTGAAASMAALLARPARFALKTAKKIGRFLKTHFHFLRRCATMKLYRWRFHRMQRSSEEGKGRNVRAKEKEDRQAP